MPHCDERCEDIALRLFVTDRLERTTGERLTAAEFLSGIGMTEFIAQLGSAPRDDRRTE